MSRLYDILSEIISTPKVEKITSDITISKTSSTYNLLSGKKFSDYDLLVFVVGANSTNIRRTVVVPSDQWKAGATINENMLHASEATTASSYTVSICNCTYVSDTALTMVAAAQGAINLVRIYGVKASMGGYYLTALSHLVTSVRRWSHEQTWKYIKRYHRKSDRPWNVCGNSAHNRTNNISGEYQHNFNAQHNKVRVLSDRHCRCSVELDRGTNCVVKSNTRLLVRCFKWECDYKLFCEKYAHIKNSIHIHILCSLGENLTTISERGCVA